MSQKHVDSHDAEALRLTSTPKNARCVYRTGQHAGSPGWSQGPGRGDMGHGGVQQQLAGWKRRSGPNWNT
eukprot:1772443-Pleurochrysis_carterae.AAC.1